MPDVSGIPVLRLHNTREQTCIYNLGNVEVSEKEIRSFPVCFAN